MSFDYRDSGSFTSAATLAFQDVLLPHGQPDLFVLRNRQDWGDDGNVLSIESRRYRGMAEEAFLGVDQTGGDGTLQSAVGTTNGFRFIDTFSPPTFAALATTAISNVEPSVATMGDTGSIQVGSVVRLDTTTAMLQISGYDFEVRAVSVNASITLQLDAQNEAAAATAGNVRLIVPNQFYPRRRFIVPYEENAGITVGATPVVSCSVSHDFTVGEKVRFKVPAAYGMPEINNLTATVTSVGSVVEGTYTAATTGSVTSFEIDIDTSGFTAFALPTSALYAAGLTPAEVIPAGSGPVPNANPPGVSVDAAFDNRNRFFMRCGTNVIVVTSRIFDWEAYYSNLHTAV